MRCRLLQVVVFLCCGLAVGLASGQALPGARQDPIAGSKVFGAKGCSRCHSINGVGGKIGPDLGRTQRPRTFNDLAAALWNHLPRMAAAMQEHGIVRPRLDVQGAADLVAFLFTVDYFDPPGDVKAGRRAFEEKRCISCHQVEGSGGVVGPPLDFFRHRGSAILVAAALWNHGPAMSEAMRERDIPRPVFRPGELRDLIAYLDAASTGSTSGPLYVLPGRAAEGRRLFRERGCLRCHAVDSAGGHVGPDLVERQAHRTLTDFAAAMWNKTPAMLRAMQKEGVLTPQLRPDEMANIVAYLYSVRYFGEPGDTGSGLRKVAERACTSCHGSRADDRAVALDRVKGLDGPAAILAALWNHAEVAATTLKSGAKWPDLGPTDMAELVPWLEGRALAQSE